MSLLSSEPSGRIESLEELFAIAHAMEHEAATRYAEIAVRLRADGNARLAEVFERLSADERGHIDSVVHWSERERGRAPDPSLVRWELPQTFDDEGAGTTDPRLLTAYRSLSMAVRNEERAFAFWTYVVAHAEQAEIRRAAEAMAHEELGHVATLRRERRRAFHAERPSPSAGTIRPDLASLELRLSEQLDGLASAADAEEAARLRRLAAHGRDAAAELRREPLRPPGPESGAADPPEDPLATAEWLVDHYLQAAERQDDEARVSRAQRLAARAINRLAWLRTDLPELARR